MKAIIELVDLVTRYKRRQIEILGYNEEATNNYESFYDLIAKGAIRTDDEAAVRMFGKGKGAEFDAAAGGVNFSSWLKSQLPVCFYGTKVTCRNDF